MDIAKFEILLSLPGILLTLHLGFYWRVEFPDSLFRGLMSI